MKKSLKTLVLLLLAVPIIFVGCKKTESTDSVNSKNTVQKDVPVYCGTPQTFNLYDFGADATVYGTVTIGNDANNLYVTVNLADDWVMWNDGLGWWEAGCNLYAGSEAGILALNPYNVINHDPDQTGYLVMGNFPYVADPLTTQGTQSYMFTVPRAGISPINSDDPNCTLVFVGVSIKNTAGTIKVVSAKQTFKHPVYWLKYCFQNCIIPSCNTAYAKGEGSGVTPYCFYNSPLNLNNWGWTNKIVGASSTNIIQINWPMYAGNPSCEPLHDPIGYFKGTYNGTTLHVMYDLNDGFTLDESHLWVGLAASTHPYLYWKSGSYVAAPGKYTYNNVFTEGVYYDISVSGTIYLAAHAKVCGEYPW
jgi:hypothetical protein